MMKEMAEVVPASTPAQTKPGAKPVPKAGAAKTVAK
jgi:hypothetical protein